MKVVIYIYNGMTILDAVGPYEVLRNVEDVEIQLVAKRKGTVTADSHFVHLRAKHRMDEVKEADVLIIPGSTIAYIKEAKNQKVLNWINQLNETTQFTASVGAGSVILAASGLLKEKKATSHWKSIKMLAEYGAIAEKERIVKAEKFISAAGASAGIDLGIFLVNELKGEKAARAAQLSIEYAPAPLYDSGNVDKCDEEIIKLAEMQMERDTRKDLSWWERLRNAKSLRKLREH